ncbi:MAG: MBL fold metallo-hydrolase [Candidatus Dormibacteria bacterium]|jgi:glyoxylase-like metal-dependent hydrolase (beta-lactamase superfamily II)
MSEQPMQKPDWFTVELVSPQTFALSEYGHWEETHSYLFVGSERAALVDTGLGVGNIRAEVEKLTEVPVIVCTTHCHWDHIGGHSLFDQIAVHRLDADWMENGIPVPVEAHREELMREPFGKQPPAQFTPARWARFQGRPTIVLEDRDVIDLGNRRLTALHTPGHSPGHLCFQERATGLLCTGDLFYRGTLYADYESTDPTAFATSLNRIAELPHVERILPGHHQLNVQPCELVSVRQGLRDLAELGRLHHGSGLQRLGASSILL